MLNTPVNQSPLSRKVEKKLEYLGLTPSSKLLLGVSGGVDSMVLLTIVKEINQNITAAHINFQLRGHESDEDASLVRNWCLTNAVSYVEFVADTNQYAAQHNVNTQSAAREIRYNWWKELVENHAFDYVATAHHLDDDIETFFLNILRGTGIKGLGGIPAKRDFYIRPMLDISRNEIETFASAYAVPYRTDRSNDTDDYHRNRVRHHLIPLLRELNPDLNAVMLNQKRRIDLEWSAWDMAYVDWQNKKFIKDGKGVHIIMESLDQAFMLRWLEEKDIPWSLVYDFINATNADSGKVLTYGPYTLSRTSIGFYFEMSQHFQPVSIDGPGRWQIDDHTLTIEKVSRDEFTIQNDARMEYADLQNITWPLEMSSISPGDLFQPIGMHGHSKKIQDYLVDHKIEYYQKKQIRVLRSKEHIIWLIGMRLDERVRVKSESETIYRLSFK